MEELVKRLREIHPEEFGNAWDFAFACQQAMHEAADAIEQLSADLERLKDYEAFWKEEAEEALRRFQLVVADKPRWISVEERLPSDFVSVQAHMTDAGNFPPVREAYVVNKNWFFPALKEFHPVDMWKRFDEPPEDE